jgi:hypothetical protein
MYFNCPPSLSFNDWYANFSSTPEFDGVWIPVLATVQTLSTPEAWQARAFLIFHIA